MPLAPPEPIHTPRVTVRLLEESDLPGLMAVNGDDQVTRFLPYATWRSPEDAQAWHQRMQGLHQTGTALQFVLLDRATGEPAGTCLLFRHDEGSARAELGYVLGRAHWGSGLMQEALQGLLACAFGPLQLRRLEAEVNPANVASTRLLQRLGFTREGVLRQRWVGKGEPYDVVVFGLLSHEFKPATPR